METLTLDWWGFGTVSWGRIIVSMVSNFTSGCTALWPVFYMGAPMHLAEAAWARRHPGAAAMLTIILFF